MEFILIILAIGGLLWCFNDLANQPTGCGCGVTGFGLLILAFLVLAAVAQNGGL